MRSTEEKIKRKVISVVIIVAILSTMAGCGKSQSRKEPITLTIWHVYGGQTDSPLNDLIDEFNGTEGKKEGIKIQVGMVSNTNTIHEEVLKAANKDPGAAKLPDLFISYPKTVLAMNDSGILADYHDYFSENELKDFIPEFLKEGEIDGRLLVFPVAKSTEILFVNKTIFDRFSADTGASMEQLTTWEDLFDLADTYYEWSDAQTPDVEGDGKSMFVHDYHFNYFQLGVESLGTDFFNGDKIVYDTSEFGQVWEPYARAAIEGGIWLNEGYATEPLRTGESIVSAASSASVLYYEDIVTYSDNRSEPIEIIARPVPVFKNGGKLVMQRGAGICLTKSDPEREEAAAKFVKWLTEPEKNVQFVTSVGYMPVTEKAFELLPEAINNLTNEKYKSLYQAFIDTQNEYTFYCAPQMDSYLDSEMKFEKNIRMKLTSARKRYMNNEADIETLEWDTFQEFSDSME